MPNRVTPAHFFKRIPKAKRYQEGHELTENEKKLLEKDRKFIEETTGENAKSAGLKIKSGEIKLKKGGSVTKEDLAGINYNPTKDLPVQPAETIPPDMIPAKERYDEWRLQYDQLVSQMKAARPSKEERIKRAIETNEFERLKQAVKFMKRDERMMMEAFIAANETMSKILEQAPQPPTPSPSPQQLTDSQGSHAGVNLSRAEANVILPKFFQDHAQSTALCFQSFSSLFLFKYMA